VEEATAANIYVTGYAFTSRAIDRGLDCAVRCIGHGNLLEPRSIPLFKEHGAFYVPTIVTYHCLAARARDGALSKDDLLVIDGNPLEDIRVLTTPSQTLRLIMTEGQIYHNKL
jgi:imidazolonepropionase-like amidohydrolase